MKSSVVVRNLGKKFTRNKVNKPKSFIEVFTRGFYQRSTVETFWGLKNITFVAKPGQMIGIIGKNGAGKSTLLRLLGGVGHYEEGTVAIKGSVGGFLDLQAGFRGDLTGRENVFVNGVIAGLSRKEIEKRFSEIVHFAELEDFIDNPIRTYSSGMKMRLAFSIAAHTNPDILLIDEVLAVGDISFRRKCFERLKLFKESGCIVFFVSHNMQQVSAMCDEVIWLEQGKIRAQGESNEIVGQYVQDANQMSSSSEKRSTPLQNNASNVHLTKAFTNYANGIKICEVSLLNSDNKQIDQVNAYHPVLLKIKFLAEERIPTPVFTVSIKQKESNKVCFKTNTAHTDTLPSIVQGCACINLLIPQLILHEGEYYIDVGAFTEDWSIKYDFHWRKLFFSVTPNLEYVKKNMFHYWKYSDDI